MKIANLTVETTPIHALDLVPHGNAKNKDTYSIYIHWGQNSGMYGYQVAYQVYKNHSLEFESKTSGCGFCKTSHAFEHCFNYVLKESGSVPKSKHLSIGGDIDYYLHKFRTGGNHYQATINQVIKAVKRNNA